MTNLNKMRKQELKDCNIHLDKINKALLSISTSENVLANILSKYSDIDFEISNQPSDGIMVGLVDNEKTTDIECFDDSLIAQISTVILFIKKNGKINYDEFERLCI